MCAVCWGSKKIIVEKNVYPEKKPPQETISQVLRKFHFEFIKLWDLSHLFLLFKIQFDPIFGSNFSVDINYI